MACGLPVVVTVQCGAAELVRDGENGFVCDARDEGSLASALAQADATRARDMGARARETAARFGLDAMARELVALYRDLARGPGGQRL